MKQVTALVSGYLGEGPLGNWFIYLSIENPPHLQDK
jgi:hypothetical protein